MLFLSVHLISLYQSVSSKRNDMKYYIHVHGCDNMFTICRMRSTSICPSTDCEVKYYLRNRRGRGCSLPIIYYIRKREREKNTPSSFYLSIFIFYFLITLAIIIYSIRALLHSTVALLIVCPSILLQQMSVRWSECSMKVMPVGCINRWMMACWHE